MKSSFDRMPASPPTEATAPTLLATMLQAAGYRYRWATADLPSEALGFRPAPTGMALGELLDHMQRLAGWLESTFVDPAGAPTSSGNASTVDATMASLHAAASAVEDMSPEALSSRKIRRGSSAAEHSFWTVLHGPLADFLTHVGQVTSWRRMYGSPAPSPRYLAGLPPEEPAPGRATPAAPSSRFADEDLSGATFHDVALTGSDFNDVSLAGSKFTNVTLAGATLHDVDLSNVQITDANVDGLRINGKLLN